jgi:hypothetical protein
MGQRAFVQSEHWRRGLKLGRPHHKGSKVHTSRAGYACGLYLGDPSGGSTIEVVAEELGPSLRWRRRARPGRRGTSTSRQLDQHSGERDAGDRAACQRSTPSCPCW